MEKDDNIVDTWERAYKFLSNVISLPRVSPDSSSYVQGSRCYYPEPRIQPDTALEPSQNLLKIATNKPQNVPPNTWSRMHRTSVNLLRVSEELPHLSSYGSDINHNNITDTRFQQNSESNSSSLLQSPGSLGLEEQYDNSNSRSEQTESEGGRSFDDSSDTSLPLVRRNNPRLDFFSLPFEPRREERYKFFRNLVLANSSYEDNRPSRIYSNMRRSSREQQEKDDHYKMMRDKNNAAAKKSRDARRNREDETAIRVAFLELEYLRLQREIDSVMIDEENERRTCEMYFMKKLGKFFRSK